MIKLNLSFVCRFSISAILGNNPKHLKIGGFCFTISFLCPLRVIGKGLQRVGSGNSIVFISSTCTSSNVTAAARPFNRGLTDKPFVLTHRSPTINDYSKQLKAAIEQIQRLLAKGRTKLQEDFDEWCVCARATVYAVYVCVYVIIREGPDKAAG